MFNPPNPNATGMNFAIGANLMDGEVGPQVQIGKKKKKKKKRPNMAVLG